MTFFEISGDNHARADCTIFTNLYAWVCDDRASEKRHIADQGFSRQDASWTYNGEITNDAIMANGYILIYYGMLL